MESRNILLIVICICAFLVLIFGIGFVWSLPDKGLLGTEKPQDDENGNGTDIFEHMKDETLPGLKSTEEPIDDKIPIDDGEKEDEPETETEKEEKKEINTGEEASETDADAEKETEKTTYIIRVPKDDEPEYPTTWITKPQPTPVPVQKPTTAPRRLKRITEYWIQAGSFQSRSKADALNEKLAEHGFQGQIKTRELNNITHYRVRIGPYQNKKEAEKFLEWLKVLDGMQNSFISEVYTDKWVN